MSDHDPNDPTFNDNSALPPGHLKGEPPRTGEAAQRKANQERDADLARLAELQKEYVELRDETSKAPPVQVNPAADALRRKGDVVREMDAIKRKHNLS